MTKNIFIILGFLFFSFVSAMAVKLILSFNAWDTRILLDLGFASLRLKYTINTGINFGLAAEASQSRQLLLAVMALVISLGTLVFALWRNTMPLAIAGGLLAGGGLTNAYERLAYDGVFDYLNISVGMFLNRFSFNVADIYIFLGASFLILFGKKS